MNLGPIGGLLKPGSATCRGFYSDEKTEGKRGGGDGGQERDGLKESENR